MECGESFLSGTGELELDPNIVSEEAGKLYSELQVTHLKDFIFSPTSNVFLLYSSLCICNDNMNICNCAGTK